MEAQENVKLVVMRSVRDFSPSMSTHWPIGRIRYQNWNVRLKLSAEHVEIKFSKILTKNGHQSLTKKTYVKIVDQIGDAEASSWGLICISWTDTLLGGSNCSSFFRFRCLIPRVQSLMIIHDQVSAIRDKKSLLPTLEKQGSAWRSFLKKSDYIFSKFL